MGIITLQPEIQILHLQPWVCYNPATHCGRMIMTTTDTQLPTASATQQTRTRSHIQASLVISGALFVLAFALRLYRLGAQSLWLDEGSTWAEVTRHGWGALLADLFRPTAAYPLYHLLLKSWIGIAGDSEWALRFPSALAGALTVVVMYLLALEIADCRAENAARRRTKDEGRKIHAACPSSIPSTARFVSVSNGRTGVYRRLSVIAALLFAASPFAIWHAQDAKVYSMVMLVAALLLFAVLRALRYSTWRSWLLVAGLAVMALLGHRLMLLPLAGLALACTLVLHQRHWQLTAFALAIVLSVAGVYGLASAVVTNGWQESGHVAAGPLLGLWLTFVHFSLDRGDIGGFLGMPLLVWLVPFIMLTLWGMALIVRDAWRGNMAAIVVVCAFTVPLALFAIALAFAPIYESRYATMAFPVWIVVLAWPFGNDGQRTPVLPFDTLTNRAVEGIDDGQRHQAHSSIVYRLSSASRWVLLAALFMINAAVLLQPEHGLFSGAPVKEEWRQAISYLAGELHPDDLLILHPYYAAPMWDYYAPRVTPDPLPQPAAFSNFSEGDCAETYKGEPESISECFRRRYDVPFAQFAFGKKRALLLIAPDHAATIDRPPTSDDQFGWVGLRFQFSEQQRAWPCGGERFVGVQVMCQSYPSFFGETGAAAIPQPAVPLEATFGGEIKLRGYSVTPLGGMVRPGGSLPITLYWQAVTKPTHNYSMFLHLCHDCSQPPLAGTDLPPLNGYPPAGLTTTWRVGDPVHDERTLAIPTDLPPGRYTLLLGVRNADADPTDLSTRLPVTSSDAPVLGATRLVLGEVEVNK